jgi:YD repeat-containing protein
MRVRRFYLFIALLLASLSIPPACGPQNQTPPPIPPPTPGLIEYQAPGLVKLPELIGTTAVNAMGCNLILIRGDATIDTQVGSWEILRAYSSATGWTFGPTSALYFGSTFVDQTGASYTVGTGPIEGSPYVAGGAATIRTKDGRAMEFSGGTLASVHWLGIAYPRLTFNAGTMQQCTDAKTCTTLATYSASGWNLTDGRTITYTYNPDNTLKNVQRPKDTAESLPGESYTYDANGHLSSVSTGEGVTKNISYADNRGAVSQIVQVGDGNPTWTFTQTAPPQAPGLAIYLYRTYATDPLGKTTTITWDTQQRVTSTTDPTGFWTNRTWSGLRPTTIGDSFGTTKFTWTDDAVTKLTTTAGNTFTFVYNELGIDPSTPGRYPLVSSTDSLGTVSSQTFNSLGEVATSANGAGDTTTYSSWFAPGKPATAKTAFGLTTNWTGYDGCGNPGTIMTGTNSISPIYNGHCNTRRALLPTDDYPAAGGGIQLLDRDDNGNVVKLTMSSSVSDAEAADTITIKRLSTGQIYEYDRPYGGNRIISFNALGQPYQACDTRNGVQQCTTYQFDLDGRVTDVTLPNKMETQTEYDAAGRVIKVKTLNNGALEHTKTTAYRFGKPISVTDDSYVGLAPETWTYYGPGPYEGLVEQHCFPRGECVLNADYNLRGQLKSAVYLNPTGKILRVESFQYDTAGRLTETDDNGVLLKLIVYTNGQLTQVHWGNGVETLSTWDANGFFSGDTTKDSNGNVLLATTVKTTPLQMGTSSAPSTDVTTTGGITDHQIFTSTFSAGDGNRMAAGGDGQLLSMSDDAAGTTNTLGYDVLGQITSQNGCQYGYNTEHNQLLTVTCGSTTTVTYTWDSANFLETRNGVAISWDAAGNLTQAGNVSMLHDLSGRLIQLSSPALAKDYWFGGMAEATIGGTTPNVLLIAGVRVHLDSAAKRFAHTDLRNEPDLILDENGKVVETIRYGVFGAVSTTGSDTEYTNHFSGGIDLGWLLLLGRAFDQTTGIYLQPDPTAYDVACQNCYVRNNPLLYNDPSGFSMVGTKVSGGGQLTWGGAIGSVILGITAGLVGAAEVWAAFEFANWAFVGGGEIFESVEFGAVLGSAAGYSGIGTWDALENQLGQGLWNSIMATLAVMSGTVVSGNGSGQGPVSTDPINAGWGNGPSPFDAVNSAFHSDSIYPGGHSGKSSTSSLGVLGALTGINGIGSLAGIGEIGGIGV